MGPCGLSSAGRLPCFDRPPWTNCASRSRRWYWEVCERTRIERLVRPHHAFGRSPPGAGVLVLATLTVAACVVGPLYERAVELGALRSTLGLASRAARGITVHAESLDVASAALPKGKARRLFDNGVTGIDDAQLQVKLG